MKPAQFIPGVRPLLVAALMLAGPAAAQNLTSVALSPTSVIGGTDSTGTVTLSANAPAGGKVVTLSSASTGVATVPASVTVTSGTKTKTFVVTTIPQATTASAVIKAVLGTVTKTVTLTVSKPSLTTLAVSPSTIPGGGAAVGTLTLTGPAGPSGATVTLSSSNTNVATAPPSQVISAGQSTGTFTVTGTSLAAGGTATITATWSGVSKTRSVTLQPSASLQAVGLAASSIRGGQPVAGTATLSASAPSGGVVVSLTSSDTAAATVPASVTVPQGQTMAGFTVTTAAVGSPKSVTITGVSSGVSKTAALTVEPAVLTGLTISPQSIPGGTTATGTLTLDGPAGPSGAAISLTSDDTNVATVPGSALVAAGQASGSFTITGAAVTADVGTTIRATLASETHAADISVTRTIGTLTGTVKNASTGFTLPSARVALTTDPWLETWTDGYGNYQLTDVPAGMHTVEVSYEGFSSVTSNAVTVANGQTATVPPVSLVPNPGTISGTILDEGNGNQPLEGALVTDATGLHTATTGGNGHYELTGLTPGFTYLVIYKDGFRPGATEELGVDAAWPAEVNVGVSPAWEEDRPGEIEGVVRDTAGNPVGGAAVSVVGVPGLGTTSESDGSYTLTVPAANGYLLEARKPGFRRTLSRFLRASAGNRPYHVAHDFVLPSAAATGTIELLTFDPVSRSPFRGDPWFRTPSGLWHAPVAESGIRTVTDVPAGLVWGCAGPRLLPEGGTLTMGCLGEAVVPPGSPRWAAAGIVMNRHSFEPIANATATFVNGSTVVPVTTNASGLFSTHSGPEGEYSVTVAAEGFLQTEPWVFTAADNQENGSFYGAWLWPEMPGGSVNITAPADGSVLEAASVQIALSLVSARPGDQLLWAWAWPSAGTVTSVTPVYSADGMSAVVTIDGTFPNGPLTIGVEAATRTGAGLTAQRNLTVDLPTHPTGLNVSPSTVPGGSVVTGTVTVDPPAPVGGSVVTLSSSNPAVTVPPSVSIAEGGTSGIFEIVAAAVTSQTAATISASVDSFTAAAILTVNPTVAPPLGADLGEGDASGWQGFADAPDSAVVSLDTTRVKVGTFSLRFVTDSGSDCGVRYVVPGGTHWDLRGVRFLTFWSFGENSQAFQGEQPVVVLRGPGGSIRFQPPALQTVNGEWTFHRVPLGATSDWIVTTEGSPSFGDVTSIEIHQDTWGAGLTVFYDGVAFVSDIPEDLAEGTAALWGPFASDSATATVVDDSSDLRSGASALRFETASGFDTGLVFPKPGPAQTHWDLSDVRNVTVWIRPENAQAFQGNQPVLVLRSPSGTVRYEPGDVLVNTPGWRFYEVPLDGSFAWTRTQEGTPDLSDITAIELHGDTWGAGFRLQVDGVSVGRPLPLLTLPAASAPGGSTVTASVHLSDAAPVGGRTVLISSSDSGLAAVPASVVVPEGARSATFAVAVGSVTVATPVSITVTDRGFSAWTTLRVDPVVDVTSLELDVVTVFGGQVVPGIVSIGNPAGPDGVTVMLTSSNPTAASVPFGVEIGPGNAMADFDVTTGVVDTSTAVTISASAGAATAAAVLTVVQAPPLALDSVSASPDEVIGGDWLRVDCTLTAPAPAGGRTITLSSSAPALLSVPESVFVPAGALQGGVDASTSPEADGASVTVTATDGPTQKSVVVTILSPTRIESVELENAGVFPGETVNGTVTLTTVAPAGGYVVTLASSSAEVTVPPSVTVPAGSQSVSFAGLVAAAAPGGQVTLSASARGVTAAASFSIVALSSLVASRTAAGPGQAVNVTVYLSAGVPAGRSFDVALVSSDPAAASVPATVTIPAGQLWATAAATRVEVDVDTPVDFTATAFGTSRTAHVVLEPLKVRSVSQANGRTTIGSCGFDTLTVSLNVPAPAGGTPVDVMIAAGSTTDGTAVAGSSPPVRRFIVPAGSSSIHVYVQAAFAAVPATLTLTARLGASEASGSLAVTAGTSTLSASPMSPGRGTTLALNLEFPGPAGCPRVWDFDASITSSDSTVLPVTSPVRFAVSQWEGTDATRWRALIPVPATAGAGPVRLTVSAQGTTSWVDVTVPPSALTGLSVNPMSAPGGTEITGTITLDFPAETGGPALLLASSDSSRVTVPASVTVPAGVSVFSFPISVVGSAAGSATVTATYRGGTRSATVRVLSADAGHVTGKLVDESWWDYVPGVGSVAVKDSSGEVLSSSAEDGTFTAWSEPGPSSLTFEKAGFVSRPAGPFEIAVRGTTDLGVTGMEKTVSGSCRVRGLVVDVAGQPVAGASLKLVGYGLTLTTASDGVYELTGRLLDRYRFRASKNGFATVVQDVPWADSLAICEPPNYLQLQDLTIPVEELPETTAFWAIPPVLEHGQEAMLRALLSSSVPGYGGWATYLDLTSNIARGGWDAGPASAVTVAGMGTQILLPVAWSMGLTNNNSTSEPITRQHAFFYGGVTKVATVTLLPADQKAFFARCYPPTVRGGGSRSCMVQCGSEVAPAGGLVVELASSSALASVPTSVVIPAGLGTAEFGVSTSPVSALTPVTITATSGTRTATVVLELTPAAVSSVSASPSRLLPGSAATGTIFVDAPAPPAGFIVVLVSSSADITVPATVTIAGGATSVTFPISASAAAPTGLVKVTATLNGHARSTTLDIGPSRVASVSLAPANLSAGATSVGTVTIDIAAPDGGAPVGLSSSDMAVAQVPSSVLVPSGATQATFPVTTSAVSEARTVTITAAIGGSTKAAALEVRVAAPTLTGAAPGVALPGASGIVVYGAGLGVATSVLLSGPVYLLGGTTPVCNIGGSQGPFCPEVVATATPSVDGKSLTFSLPSNAAAGTYLLEARVGQLSSANGVPFLVEEAAPAYEVVALEDHKIAQRIHSGQTVQGVLAGTAPNCPYGATDYNQYFFFATAGSRINLHMERVDTSIPWSDPASLDPQIEIVAPDGFIYGNLARFNDRPGVDFNATLTNARLPKTGLYVILAETARGSGAYRLSFSFSSVALAPPDDRVIPAAGNHVTGHVGDTITSWAQVLDPRGYPLTGAAMTFQQMAEPGDTGTIQFTSGANVSSSSLGVASVNATLTSFGRVRFAPVLQQTFAAPAAAAPESAAFSAGAPADDRIPLYPAVAMRPFTVGYFDGELLGVENAKFERFPLAPRPMRVGPLEETPSPKGVLALGSGAPASAPVQPYGPDDEARGEVPVARFEKPGLLATSCQDGLRFHTFAVPPSAQINAPLRVTLEDLTPSTGQETPNGPVGDKGIYGHRIEKEIRLRIKVLDANGNEPDYPVLVSVSLSGAAAGTVILDPEGARLECPTATFVWHERDANGTIVALNEVVGYRLGTFSQFLGLDNQQKPVWNYTEIFQVKTFTPGQEQPSVQLFGVHPEPGKPDRVFCRDDFGQLCGDSFRYWTGHHAYENGKKPDGSPRFETEFATTWSAYHLVDEYENVLYGYFDAWISEGIPSATFEFVPHGPAVANPQSYKIRARWTNDPAWPSGSSPATLTVHYPEDPDWAAGDVTRAITLNFEAGVSRALSKHRRYDLIRPDGTRGVDDGTFPIRAHAKATSASLPKTEAGDGARLVLLAYRGEVVPGEWPELEPSESGARVWTPEGDHWRIWETRTTSFLETAGPSSFRLTLIDHDWNVIQDGDFVVHRCPRFDHSASGSGRPCPLAPVASVSGRVESVVLNPGGAGANDSRGYLGIELTRAPEGLGSFFVKVESLSHEYRIRRQSDFVTSSAEIEGEFQGAFKLVDVGDYPCPDARCGSGACNQCTGSPNYVSTGTYTTAATDLVVPTAGPAITVSRNYVSTPTPDGVVGPGWTSSLDARVYLAPYLSGGVRLGTEANVVLPSGLRYKFRLNPVTGHFDPLPGRKDDLVRNADGSFDLFLERGSGSAFRFDKHGLLVSETDEFGNVVSWERNLEGRVARIADLSGTGRSVTVGWTPGGKIHTLTDSTGRTVVCDYDSQGRLAGVTDPAGRRTQYDYLRGRYSTALLTRISDPWSRAITDVTYDTADRTASYTEQGTTYNYSYLDTTRTNKTDDSGHSANFTFDPASGVITTRSAEDDSFSRIVDSEGRPTQATDAAGVATNYSYDDEGHVLTVTRNSGQAGAVRYDYTYDPNFPDKVASVTPKNPATNGLDLSWQGWRYEYHPAGSTRPGGLKKVYRVASDGATADSVSEYEYDGQGRVTRQTTAGGAQTDYAYDGSGNLQTVTGPAGSGARPVTTYQHDALGRVTDVTDSLGKVTHYTYDALGRVLTVTLPPTGGRNFTTTYSYDHVDLSAGLLYTEITDPNGRLTRLGYDVDGRLRRSVDAAGGATLYGYTGRLLATITDPNGNVTSYGYDAARRLASTSFPDGGQETYTYWNDGLLKTKTDRRGTTVTYAYDAFKRLRTKSTSTGGSVTYNYEGQKLLTVVDSTVTPAETHTFDYDTRYRLASAAQAGRGTAVYTYTVDDRVESLTLPGGVSSTLGYHADGSLRSAMWSPASGSFTWDYTPRGQYDTVTFPNGQERAYGYDDQGRLTTLSNTLGAATLASTSYGYDVDLAGQPTLLGQRTSQTASLPAQGLTGALTRYGYDPLYQLVRAEYPAAAPFNAEVHTWTYDGIGNRKTQGVGANVQTYTYLKAEGNPLNGQRLTGDGADAFGYDAAGNVTGRQGPGGAFTLGYDSENRLNTITGPENATYTYDYQGRRTSKTVSGVKTTYLYDGLNLVAETTGGQTTYFLNGPSIDEPLAMSKSGVVSYFSVDGLGSVVATNDPSGTVTHSVVFDAWGNVRAETGTRTHPFTYTGREVGEAGFHFYRARFYQPSIGRFSQEDPLPSRDPSTPAFTYVHNKPLAFRDALGLQAVAYTYPPPLPRTPPMPNGFTAYGFNFEPRPKPSCCSKEEMNGAAANAERRLRSFAAGVPLGGIVMANNFGSGTMDPQTGNITPSEPWQHTFSPFPPGIEPPKDACVRYCSVRHEWAHFTDPRVYNFHWPADQAAIFHDYLAYSAELHCLRSLLMEN